MIGEVDPTIPMTAITRVFAGVCLLLVPSASVLLRSEQLDSAPRYVVHALGNDIYAVVYNPELEVEGNALIVVNDDNVVVVDSNAGLTTARLTIGEIRKITSKPVRYVINTHWHDDHVMGNQAYAEAFPGVEFVAHPATREDIVGHAFANNAFVLDVVDADIARFDGYLQTGIGRDGKPMTSEQAERVRIARRTRAEMAADRRAFRATPPTIDVADTRTLTFGKRQIEIKFLGRGNTRGDLVVYLPSERVLATGDLVVWPIPYATNVYARDWVSTLERLMTIPATTVVPGHGPVMKDWAYVRRVKGALETAIAEVAAAKRSGQSLEETTKSVQLPDLRAEFLDGRESRALSFEFNFRAGLIRNVWEELDSDVMQIVGSAAMTRVADGVHRYEMSEGSAAPRALATLIVNEKDVVLVTSASSVNEARATMRATRELTDKPVRFIVTTAALPKAVIDAYEAVYNADVIGHKSARRAVTVEGELTLYRGAREIVIRQAADGPPSVHLRRENLVIH